MGKMRTVRWLYTAGGILLLAAAALLVWSILPEQSAPDAPPATLEPEAVQATETMIGGFRLTATQLIRNATQTADAQDITADPDVDSFQLTATALIVNATTTAAAEQGVTLEPDSFMLTATALIDDATGTADADPAPTRTASSFELTATALISAATQTAAASE
ncbi:MAG: hypothetical protein AAF787_04470 [Chloroflexota bacterium]